jgi:8-oxo-dGTP diphosphatase
MEPAMPHHIEVIVRAALFRRGYVLLCRNLESGHSYLPGGHIEFGESAAAALARELREEADLVAHNLSLALISENSFEAQGRKHHELNLVFHVEHLDSEAEDRPVISREPTIAFEWVDLASIQDLDVRPPAVKAWLGCGAPIDPESPRWISEFPA